MLYSEIPVIDVIRRISAKYGVKEDIVARDIEKLLKTLLSILKRQNCPIAALSLKKTRFGGHKIVYPVLSEIALTYRCQNRCMFCYASSPRKNLES